MEDWGAGAGFFGVLARGRAFVADFVTLAAGAGVVWAGFCARGIGLAPSQEVRNNCSEPPHGLFYLVHFAHYDYQDYILLVESRQAKKTAKCWRVNDLERGAKPA